MPHTTRAFVESLDFKTTDGRHTAAVITELGILEPGRDGELELVSVSPGVELSQVLAATGWPLRAAMEIATTPEPTAEELGALRALLNR